MANSKFGFRTRLGLIRTYTEGLIATDADATSFLTAAGITDATITAAIQQLVIDLKNYSIWSKMKAIYPFVGGTSATHRWNLKDPQALDSAFYLTFVGGLTHSSNGVLPNGTTGYADTKLAPASILTSANWHLSYYSRTNVGASVDFDMGVGTSLGTYSHSLFLRRSGDTAGFDSGNSSSGNRISASSQTDSRGLFTGSIRSTSDRILYRNNSSIVSSTSTNTNTLMDSNIILFAYNERNFNSIGLSPQYYGQKECSFISIGDGLTNTEISNLYTSVQAFQTTLSRNV
jgi:hypothetical protein